MEPIGERDAWLVGGCGLRGRLTSQGFLDLNAPIKKMQIPQVLGGGTCAGVARYASVAIASDNEVYVSGDTACGFDPNTLWARPVEVFDGKKFRALPGPSPFRGPHDRKPDVLKVGEASIFALALGDDWHGSPNCAVFEMKKGRWTLLRACQLPPDDHTGPSEVFSSIGVDEQSHLWISGTRLEGSQDDPSTPLLLKRESGHWQRVDITDAGQLLNGLDGTLWLWGHSLWHLEKGTWKQMSLELPAGTTDLAVVGVDDYWAIAYNQALHNDGHGWVQVPVEDESGDLIMVRASHGQVWVAGHFQLWQLANPDQPGIVAARLTPLWVD